MKKLYGLLFLISTVAMASPMTMDQLYFPQGLQLIGPQGTFLMPNGSPSVANDPIISGAASQNLANKTFDKSSNVSKQARGVYDVSVSGGATSANISLNMNIPFNAIITNGGLDFVTQFASTGGNPTIGISAQTGADILGDTLLGSLPSTGLLAVKETGASSTFVKLNSGNIVGSTGVTVNIKSGNVSAGKFILWLDYRISE